MRENSKEEREMKKARFRGYLPKIFLMMFADVLGIILAYLIALWVRADFTIRWIPFETADQTVHFLPWIIITSIVVYYLLHLYHSIWSYVSSHEAFRIAIAYIIIGCAGIVENELTGIHLPGSVLFMGFVLSLFGCTLVRFSYPFFRKWKEMNATPQDGERKRVLVIGAGQAAREVIRDLQMSRSATYHVEAIIDDNPIKWGRYLEGVCIVGGRQSIPEVVKKYQIQQIIYAITTAKPADRSEILNICKETGCKLQTVPSMEQIISGDVNVTRLRDVSIEDLLGRNEVKVDTAETVRFLRGKVVMVTGGGGSIGSELCRQIAAAKPELLIIFDIYENNAYAIQQELWRDYPYLNLVTLIGSVRNTNRVNSILMKYHPDIIYHAAAHKHVPLMEDSPNEAIKNNVMGTWKLATAAAKAHVERFLLISTDKAVNPTNIMGASKRLCEMVIQMMSRKYPSTVFMAVRFGNVLGSNGSVVPLFRKQIEEGGPVTVTDKNIIRYFMTIPEAVSLVLEAGRYAKGGEIFVLDMGKPVRIDDMARNLIKLSGYKPDVDIKIVYTGLRPGEKLFEELLMDEEGMQKTDNNKIYIGHPIEMNDEKFEKQIVELDRASRAESPRIKELVSEIVPTYHPETRDVTESTWRRDAVDAGAADATISPEEMRAAEEEEDEG